MEEAFKAWLVADGKIHAMKEQIKAIEQDILLAQQEANEARLKVEDIMAADGVREDITKGEFIDYVINYTTPRISVKVENPDAVPDKFVKIERKPKLKEIGDELKRLQEAGEDLPNWAIMELGQSKLTYKARTRN